MRTFIAIELSEATRAYLSQLQEELKESRAQVSWVKPDNIHVTLKFLGEIEEKQLPKIAAVLEEIASRTTAFTISVASLGAFPKMGAPRVIWAGIDEGKTALQTLAKETEEQLAKIGFPKENRPFSAHITLGRVRGEAHLKELVEILEYQAGKPHTAIYRDTVDKLIIFKSTLTPQGSLYEPLKLVPLTRRTSKQFPS